MSLSTNYGHVAALYSILVFSYPSQLRVCDQWHNRNSKCCLTIRIHIGYLWYLGYILDRGYPGGYDTLPLHGESCSAMNLDKRTFTSRKSLTYISQRKVNLSVVWWGKSWKKPRTNRSKSSLSSLGVSGIGFKIGSDSPMLIRSRVPRRKEIYWYHWCWHDQ